MSRGLGWAAGCALLAGLPATHALATESRADDLARRLLIVDTHIDAPAKLLKADADLAASAPDREFDFPRAFQGGLDAAFMSIYVPPEVDAAGDGLARADALIDRVEQMAMQAPDKFALATCADDLARIKAEGRVALPMGLENGGPIGSNLGALGHLHQRGIRYITLAHGKANVLSDSSYDASRPWLGLSPYGKAAVQAMNRLGVMIDVSHLTDAAVWQVLALSEAPVIASHSSLRHFTPGFERNLPDALVTAIGEQGGVVQINFGSTFLTAEARAWSDARQAAVAEHATEQGLAPDDPALDAFGDEWRAENPLPFAAVDDVLDHIDRSVELAGIGAVGFGSDYEGVGDSLPVGLKDVGGFPNLIAGLLARGYSEADIARIAGDNLLRVWRRVEQIAAKAGNPSVCRFESGAVAVQG